MASDSGSRYPAELPLDREAEQVVLAVIFRSRDEFDSISQLGLRAEYFCVPENRAIFRLLMEIRNANGAFDQQTLERGVGPKSRTALAELTEYVGRIHIPHGCFIDSIRVLHRKLILRRIQRLLRSLMRVRVPRYQKKVSQELLRAVGELHVANDASILKGIKEHVMDTVEDVERAYEGSRKAGAGGTGFPTLDRTTCWTRPGNVVVLASGSRAGATALAVRITQQFGVRGKNPMAYFTTDLDSRSLVKRIMSSDSTVELARLTDGRLRESDFSALTRAASQLAGSGILIEDAAGVEPLQLWSAARALKKEHNIKVMIVDRLELNHASSDISSSEAAQASTWMPALKAIAEDLDLAVFVLARIARRRRSRNLSKLFQAGDLTLLRKTADVFLLLARPYPATRGVERLLMSVEVRRRGALGVLSLAFDVGRGLLGEIDAPMDPPPAPAPTEL